MSENVSGSSCLVGPDHVHDRVDQRQVRERLREVPEVAAARRLDLLGVEAERAGERQQPLAQLAGAAAVADLRQRGDEPERADREAALLAREAVVGLLRAVAQHEPVVGQLVGHRQHGRADARVVGRQEAHQRHQQHGGVERGRVVVLGEHAAVVERVLADVGVDLRRARRPALGQLELLAQLGEPAAAVDRDPAHQLRRGEVLRVPAHLPDAAVGVAASSPAPPRPAS